MARRLKLYLITVVIGKFNKMEMIFPRSSIIQDASTKKILKNLIYPLRLTVSLWVVSGAQVQTSTQGLLECFPKLTGENRISIAHNAKRNAMEANNLPHIDFG